MGFRDVRRDSRARGAEGERDVQSLLGMSGATAVPGGVALGGAPGSVGETSPNFHDDPVVSALASLPSQQQAEQYTGAKPSFYGVQRPGDWQRVVQRQMAVDRLPGGQEQLAKMTDLRLSRARRGGFPQQV